MSNDFIIGDTFGFSGQLKDSLGADFNLTGYTIAAEMWTAPDNFGVQTKLSDLVATIVTPASGLISLSATSGTTAAWTAGGARTRVIITSGAGVKTSADTNKFNLRK